MLLSLAMAVSWWKSVPVNELTWVIAIITTLICLQLWTTIICDWFR